MIPLTNYDFQWGRSEVVIIYPGTFLKNTVSPSPFLNVIDRQGTFRGEKLVELLPQFLEVSYI